MEIHKHLAWLGLCLLASAFFMVCGYFVGVTQTPEPRRFTVGTKSPEQSLYRYEPATGRTWIASTRDYERTWFEVEGFTP